MDNTQLDPVAIITGLLAIIGLIWKFAKPFATKLAEDTGKRIIEESAKAARNQSVDVVTELEAKLKEEEIANKYTFDRFLQSATDMRLENLELKRTVTSIEARMTSAEAAASAAQSRAGILDGEIKQLRSDLEQRDADVQRAKRERDEETADLKAKLDAANNTIAQLERDLAAARRDIDKLLAMIKTDELPVLETAHGKKRQSVEVPAVGDSEKPGA